MAIFCLFFFFKQKTAYEMRISDWSSDVALPISIYPKLQAIFRRLYWDFLGRIWYFRRTDFLSRRAVESLTAAALNQSCQALATAVRSRLAWRLFPKTRRICNPPVDSRFVPARDVNAQLQLADRK